MNFFDHGFPCFTFFNAVIDAFFDENAFERIEVPFFLQFAEFDFEFEFEEFASGVRATSQDFAYTDKNRLVIFYDAGIWRNG